MDCERCKINNLSCCKTTSSSVFIDGNFFGVRRCTDCLLGIDFQGPDGWRSIEHILRRESQINGLQPAISTEDKVVHYILSQFVYNETENPEECLQHAKFDVPDEQDIIMLLWSNCVAIGFYTLKLRGTWIQETDEVYTMTTLDTIFIRKSHRKKGYCQEMLRHICSSYHDEDIGISTPISFGMKAALQRFLTDHPQTRSRLWEINGTGREGFRKLIWFVLAKEKSRDSEQAAHT